MRKFLQTQAGSEAGFTLVELMIVIVIASILIAISVPSYLRQSREARRTQAKTALLDLAGREERLMSTKGAYSNAPADVGYTGPFPEVIGNSYYNINITGIAAATAPSGTTPGTPAAFLLTATAINSQTADTQCESFTVDQQGNQLSYNSGGTVSTGCW
jgi:type IV pilus assembly protein PilE